MNAAIASKLSAAIQGFKSLLPQGQPAIVSAVNIALDLGFGIVEVCMPKLLQPITGPVFNALEAEVKSGLDAFITAELSKAA
jgi:hypothetical protein